LCGSVHIGMFIAFRFFAGAGSWMSLAAAALMMNELAQPTFGEHASMSMAPCSSWVVSSQPGLALAFTGGQTVGPARGGHHLLSRSSGVSALSLHCPSFRSLRDSYA
jgi:hypothetical protein